MIDYRIEVADAHAHLFRVTLRIPRPQATQWLSLPVWIPGSYLVREFARHLSPISARQGSHELTAQAMDKSHWQVQCPGRGALVLSYEVYAFDTSVRAAFLDAHRGFFNGTSTFLCAQGFENEAHRLTITGLPKGWEVATGLPAERVNAAGWGEYRAESYDALIDHPVELGRFWRGGFKARGVPHEFIVAGASADFDGQRLLDDSKRICEAQIAFWHGRRKPVMDRYVFMLNVVEDGYGGLEHRNSTALICARKDLPRHDRPVNQEAYTTLLGLISHEYFHTWNVKRLKPVEFSPYDLTRENHTRMLWFFEGFTSYYDDQFLLRTGLIDAPTYLKLLGRALNQVLATPGRLSQSVGQASFDAWTRYYRPDENTLNATVSYYTKGALVALGLDLCLRQLPATEGTTPCLDGVMQRLWQLGRPIEESDVAHALHEEAGGRTPPHTLAASWADLLSQWVHGTDDLPLETLLRPLGVACVSRAAPLPQRLGVRLKEQAGVLTAQSLMRGGLFEAAGVSAGDELLSLDGWRLRRTDDLLTWHDARRTQTLTLCRDQRVLSVSLPPLDAAGPTDKGSARPAASLLALALVERPSQTQSQSRQHWLKA